MNERALAALESARPALRAHGGDAEIVSLEDGVVRLRFLGMCTACPLRPITVESTLRPALISIPGIERVEIEGSRISAEAEARLARAFRTGSRPGTGSGDTEAARVAAATVYDDERGGDREITA